MTGNASLNAHPDLDQWIEIGADERVVVHTGKVDIGQRISTALAIIVASELDVDYARVDVRRTVTGVDPDEGVTAGSQSLALSGEALRLAAATARRHLLSLAAETLGVGLDTLEVEDGLVQSRAVNRSVTYWTLLGDRHFGIPVDAAAAVRTPAGYASIGHSVCPKGMHEMVSGRFRFVHDLRLPGMLHARVVRPPHYHAALERIDTEVVRQLAGANIETVRDGRFLAVAGPDEHAVVAAAERLRSSAEWSLGEGLESVDAYAALSGNERISLPVRDGAPREAPVPALTEPPGDAAATLTAEFRKPYLMHASLGPSAAYAVWKEGGLDLWCHSQGVYPLRGALSEALGVNAEDIRITHTPGAGCYGHNGADDAAFDAAFVARALPGIPVLLKWSREDEHAWEPYASAMLLRLRASVDAGGRVVDWSHESYADTFNMRPVPGRAGSAAGKLIGANHLAAAFPRPTPQPSMGPHTGIHRNLDPLYTFARRRLVKNLVRGLPLRTSALRTLGAFGNVFAIESFVDELAEAAGVDPVELRLRHLDDWRARAVITALAKRMGAEEPSRPRGKGIGFARYKNAAAYVAVGIEVEVSTAAVVRVLRAWVVCDAGEVVDPDGLVAQMEGGLIQALSWALHEEVTWDRGGITSCDWESYPILRFDNVPSVDTVLMERPGLTFLGAGEAVSGPTAAALANAIHAATGVRVREMPFTPENLRAAAMG